MIFALRHWKGFHNVGLRKDQWKLTKLGPNSPWKLFDITQDISESNDVSSQHTALVQEMVKAAEQWSQTHTEPQWFDSETPAKNWQEFNMPDYERTFQIEQ